MSTPAGPAVGQRTWLGVGRQHFYNGSYSGSSVGLTTTPTIWHGVDTFNPVEKWAFIDRPEVRYLADGILAAPGPYSFSGSLKVAPDPGAVEQLLAHMMGMQLVPANVPYIQATSTGSIASGSHSVAITNPGGATFIVGDTLVVDTFASGEQETVTITAVTPSTGGPTTAITATFANAHAAGTLMSVFANSVYTTQFTFGPSATTGTTATAGAITTTGLQAVNVQYGSLAGFYIGSSVAVGGANPEVVTILGMTKNTITAYFTQTHLNGVSLTATTPFIRELPYIMLERQRDNDAVDYFGNAIDTGKISIDMGGKLVGFEFGLVGGVAAPVLQPSPVSPSFSTLAPYTSEISVVSYSGSSGANQALGTYPQVPVQSLNINLNNQLDKSYRTLGSQFPYGFPLGRRKVNGTMKTGFENNNAFQDFLGQGTCAIVVTMTSTSVFATSHGVSLSPQLVFTMPKCRITQDPVSHKTSGALDQTISFDAYSSGIGTNDSLSITAITNTSACY